MITSDIRAELHEKLQQYYSIEKVAKMCDVSPNTVRKWIQHEKLKARKIGGAVRISASELSSFIQDWKYFLN